VYPIHGELPPVSRIPSLDELYRRDRTRRFVAAARAARRADRAAARAAHRAERAALQAHHLYALTLTD
jgi:hypothetical protein